MSRIALVTGGTRGIGRAIAIALQDAGYIVAANYAGNEEAAKKFSQETNIATFKWNVGSVAQCEAGIRKVEEQLGAIDILVNNAGIIRDAMMHKMSEDDWNDVINVNLNSCYGMSKTVFAAMRQRNFGRIINVSSINAQSGQMGQTNYSAAKAGMIGFTKALAREGAFKNITVNVVAPGYIKTSMTQNVSNNVMDAIIAQIPVGRLGEPEEVARCVVFLAADEAEFITGETLSVNGGHYME